MRLLPVAVLLACVGTPSTSPAYAAGSYRDPRIESLPRCALNSREVPDSRIAYAPDREFAFRLPKDFSEVADPPGFIHGGALWRRGEATVSLRYGHWALDSFGDEATKCLARIASFDTVVVRFKDKSPSFVFWFLGSGPSGGHELIMGVNGATDSDEPLLISVGYSVFQVPRK